MLGAFVFLSLFLLLPMGQYWEVWNLDKRQAISLYKLGEGFLDGSSSRLERRYLDRDAMWLADKEDVRASELCLDFPV